MGFGESILLYEGDSCLLVDCGSESKYKEGYFDNVVRELTKHPKKSLLLSHFHKDHINGIKHLYNHSQIGFEVVYLPNIFENGNVALELLVLQYLEECGSKKSDSYQIWQLLYDLIKKHNQIKLIERGDDFDCANIRFKALWPIKDDKTASDTWRNIKASTNYTFFSTDQITFIANKIRNAIYFMIGYEDVTEKYKRAEEELSESLESFRSLRTSYRELLMTKDKESQKTKKQIKPLFKEIKENEHSIVFHTAEEGELQILMTGDITSKNMGLIANNLIAPFIPLKKHYHIFKAPHHGTSTHYFNLTTEHSYDRVLISNCETSNEKKRGSICEEYILNGIAKHLYCTNTIKKRCEYMKKNNQSANICVNCKASGININCSDTQISPNSEPQIVWNPTGEENFKNALIKTKRARITWEYSGGEKEDKIWCANKVTTSTNIQGNIKSRHQWRERAKNGLCKVYVEVI